MAHAPFVPLRIFSSYTMLEGAFEPKAIAKAAKARGFPAAAVCDRNGLYAAMSLSDACMGAGVQPIIGAFVSVARLAFGFMNVILLQTARNRRTPSTQIQGK